MHIKIQLINQFSGLACDTETTVQQLIITVLNKLEIPAEYVKYFVLFEILGDHMGHLIQNGMKMTKYIIQERAPEFYFRVARFPLCDFESYNENFLDFLAKQIHELVYSQRWLGDYLFLAKLAAARCGLLLGSFNKEVHNVNYISQQLKLLLHADQIDYLSSILKEKQNIDVENFILDIFQEMSSSSRFISQIMALVNYLEIVSMSPQYGCAVFSARLIANNNDNLDSFVMIGVNQHKLMIYNDKGEILLETCKENLQLDYSKYDYGTDLKVTDRSVNNSYILEANGLSVLKSLIEHIQNF